jgi:hypothetical protein
MEILKALQAPNGHRNELSCGNAFCRASARHFFNQGVTTLVSVPRLDRDGVGQYGDPFGNGQCDQYHILLHDVSFH